MGPLALLDLIGLDTAYEILDTMAGGPRRRHAPAPLLKQMVTAGLRGRKTGARLLHLRGARLPGRRRRRPDAVGAAAGRTVQRGGRRGFGTMATGIIEVLAKAGYDVCASPAAPRRPPVCER